MVELPTSLDLILVFDKYAMFLPSEKEQRSSLCFVCDLRLSANLFGNLSHDLYTTQVMIKLVYPRKCKVKNVIYFEKDDFIVLFSQ